jgi:hypothetical protein
VQLPGVGHALLARRGGARAIGGRAHGQPPAVASNVADQPPAAPLPARRLLMWHWRAALDAEPPGVTLVRISLGRRRWVPARTAAIPYIVEFAPVGRLFELDGDEFDRAYGERLDNVGVDRIEQRFRVSRPGTGDSPPLLRTRPRWVPPRHVRRVVARADR